MWSRGHLLRMTAHNRLSNEGAGVMIGRKIDGRWLVNRGNTSLIVHILFVIAGMIEGYSLDTRALFRVADIRPYLLA